MSGWRDDLMLDACERMPSTTKAVDREPSRRQGRGFPVYCDGQRIYRSRDVSLRREVQGLDSFYAPRGRHKGPMG